MDLSTALKSGKAFTRPSWRKFVGYGTLRYEPSTGRMWLLDFDDAVGAAANLTRWVRTERTFHAADVLAVDFEHVDETPLMDWAWRHRA